jgi:hypothetical protein
LSGQYSTPYQDAKGEWHSSYLYQEQVVKVIEVAQQALEHGEQHESARGRKASSLIDPR